MDTKISETISTTKADLAQLLRDNNAEITFTKKDGSQRIMKCTLKEGVIVPYEKKTDREVVAKDHLIAVWDLEADAWRSITIDTIEKVEIYDAG